MGPARRFVSRGGEKLDAALTAFDIDVTDRIGLDAGASTGGFTDCLLQRGAARVIAVDVGYGQLHDKLRADPRVTVRERTNVRDLVLEEPVDLIVADLSFISLATVAPALVGINARPAADVVALVKPQFEAGKDAAARARGVIRDASVRDAAIASAREALVAERFEVVAEVDSALPGPKGNVERFIHAVAPGVAGR